MFFFLHFEFCIVYMSASTAADIYFFKLIKQLIIFWINFVIHKIQKSENCSF